MTGLKQHEAGEEIQGFLTSENRFVDRKEAMTIQKAAGKLNTKGQPLDGQILFSEDLY